MLIHKQPPMSLGSGAASLQCKAHCVLRSLQLETHGAKGLRRVCRHAVRSFTTDLGTESGLGDIPGSISDYMPPWQRPQAFLETICLQMIVSFGCQTLAKCSSLAPPKTTRTQDAAHPKQQRVAHKTGRCSWPRIPLEVRMRLEQDECDVSSDNPEEAPALVTETPCGHDGRTATKTPPASLCSITYLPW